MRQFSYFIDELELIDLPLLGGNFTWSGGLRNQNLAHLDRFLVSQDWLDRYGNVVQLKLPRPTSDHAPILLDCWGGGGGGGVVGGGVRRGPIPFHFKNMWLKVEGF